MNKIKISQYKTSFDGIAHYIENEQKEQVEVWFARELQAVLGYARWENFLVTIQRAVESCKTQGIKVDDHFRDLTKMVELGSGAKRAIDKKSCRKEATMSKIQSLIKQRCPKGCSSQKEVTNHAN